MYSVKITFDEKREIEMIFNIQWKNKSVCVDARSNMVGMLDGSATSDYHTFKSYLLNNSGTFVNNVDNVRVSYMDRETEYYIESDFDYNYALDYFREKASAGQYIDLKLDYVDRCRLKDKEIPPPEWFLKYMKKFKEEIIEEITTVITSKQHQCNSHPTRKLKAESYKRSRKIPLLIADTNDRELSTAVKVQRKIETKLEKLEHKSSKMKTKKALMGLSSDSDAGKSSKSETNQPRSLDNETVMSAALTAVPSKKSHIAYLSGGETYVHSWDVINDGSLPWNSSTKLKYAWGSQALEPWEKDINCPYLKPGQSGCISVTFNVPVIPGMYECYWHFYSNGKRFGISLSSVVVVANNPVRAEGYIRGPTYDVINIQDSYELVLPTAWTSPAQKQEIAITKENGVETETNQMTSLAKEKDEGDSNINEIIDFMKGHVKISEEMNHGDQFEIVSNAEKENLEHPIQLHCALDVLNETKPTESLENSPAEDNNNFQNEKNTTDFDFLDESDDQSIISISESNASSNTKSGEDFILLQEDGMLIKADDIMQQNTPNYLNDLVEAIEDAKISTSSHELTNKKPILKTEVIDKKLTEEENRVNTTDSTKKEIDVHITNISSPTYAVGKVSNDQAVETTGDTEDILKIVKTPMESCEPCKGYISNYFLNCHQKGVIGLKCILRNPSYSFMVIGNTKELKPANYILVLGTTSEYAYILYKGRKIPVPKQYLREDYLKTAEEVPKEIIPNINYLLIDSFLRMESASGLKKVTGENGAIPKNIKVSKKEKTLAKLKSKSVPSTCSPKHEKKCEKIQKALCNKTVASPKKVTKVKEVKRIVKKVPNPVCCSTMALNGTNYGRELPGDNQRFFVFPQQSPGYEIIHHFPKANGSYDCDPAATAAEDEAVFVKVYVLYKSENYEDTDFYAYFVPLDHVEQYPPELEDSIDKRQLMHYAVPTDVNSIVNSAPINTDYFDYKYVLLPLRQGILYADFRYPSIMKQNLYNLVDLQSTFDFYRRMNHASTARIGNEHCVLTLNSEDYFVYEIKTVTRYVAINLNIKPQSIIPQYNLKLYTITPPSLKSTLKAKKCIAGKKHAESNGSDIKLSIIQRKEALSENKIPTKSPKKDEGHPASKTTKTRTTEPNGNTTKYPLLCTPKTKTEDSSQVKKKHKKAGSEDSDAISSELQTGSSFDSDTGKAEFFHLLKGKMDGLKKTVIDTAKEVIDIVTPPTRSNDGYWCQGHWISTNPNSKREQALQILHEMGFKDRDLNATLLARFGDDLTVTLTQLLEYNLEV